MDDAKLKREELNRDAQHMIALKESAEWECVIRQLDKAVAQATAVLLDQTATMDQVNFWRGRLAAVREFRVMPEMIVAWAKTQQEK